MLDPPMNSLPLPRLNRAAFVRRILVAGVMLAGFGPALRAAEGTASPPVLRAAAVTFSVQPRVGMPSGGSRTANLIEEVVGDLKTTLVYLDYGSTRLCFVTSPFGVHYRALNQPIRQALADVLKLSLAEVVAASSHNHTVPAIELGAGPPMIGDRIGTGMNEFGREYLEALRAAAQGLDARLAPVTVEWGVAQESRFTYNRRGRRPDGRSYFIREEDRVLLGEDYVGTIDPDATVVVFRGANGKPVAALASYTGHPVTGYNPERMTSHGQWPQVACERLSAHLGGVPVGFLQGSCGDVNSKHMLTGTLAQADEAGEQLGESFIAAAGRLRKSQRPGLEWTRARVIVPQAPLPPLGQLERELAEIDGFIQRARRGDPDTLECVGMNFPKALTPQYRARLVEIVRPWYIWAVDQRRTGEADGLQPGLKLEIVVARFGDVGYVGMPAETFVRIGLRIKREAPLPCVIAGGYADGSYGYIPDAAATGDREYMSGFFRYVPERLPYTGVGGEAMAEVAVPILARFAKAPPIPPSVR